MIKDLFRKFFKKKEILFEECFSDIFKYWLKGKHCRELSLYLEKNTLAVCFPHQQFDLPVYITVFFQCFLR